jgi:AAA+ ATPase superfamily predicted ATPase
MLYIIAGAPRSGKSTLARKISKEKNIPYFPLDALTGSLEDFAPEVGVLHGAPFIQWAENAWPILSGVLENLHTSEDSYIVEGDGVLPASVKQLVEKIGADSVRVCYLGCTTTTRDEKIATIRTYNTSKDDWTNKYSDEQLKPMVENMLEKSRYIRQECEKHRITYFDISDNFEDAQKKAFEYLI